MWDCLFLGKGFCLDIFLNAGLRPVETFHIVLGIITWSGGGSDPRLVVLVWSLWALKPIRLRRHKGKCPSESIDTSNSHNIVNTKCLFTITFYRFFFAIKNISNVHIDIGRPFLFLSLKVFLHSHCELSPHALVSVCGFNKGRLRFFAAKTRLPSVLAFFFSEGCRAQTPIDLAKRA